LAFDLAYLKHIIRSDAVLPAAGLDDCEHRFRPSCVRSQPRTSRPGRLFVQSLWVAYVFRALPKLEFAQKQAAREPRAGWRDL
jgi:hypothetical protein